MISADYYFFIASLIFISFFIVISLFGFIILKFFSKDIQLKTKLSIVLLSFGIGVSIYQVYSLIITLFNIFSFFTSFLPILIFDVIYLLKMYYQNRSSFQKESLKKGLNNVSNKVKSNKVDIIIIILVFVLCYFLLISYVRRYISYPAVDPYLWFDNAFTVHSQSSFDFIKIEANTPGFVLFCATLMSFTTDYFLMYYILLYVPIFLMCFNILVLYSIANSIFKKKIDVYFTLFIFLGFNYIFYRYTMPLHSILATSIGFILFLFLNEFYLNKKDEAESELVPLILHKTNHKYNLLKAILLIGIFMSHSLYGFFALIFYFIYDIYILITNFRSTDRKGLKGVYLRKFLINQGSLIILFILLSLPFIIGFSYYLGYPVYMTYVNMIFQVSVYQPGANLGDIITFIQALARFIILNPINIFFEAVFGFGVFHTYAYGNFLRYFYEYTLRIGLLLIIIGLFISLKKIKPNERQRNTINFVRFTFIVTLAFYLLNLIINISAISPEIYAFLQINLRRLFELFGGYWAILFVISFRILGIKIFNSLKEKRIKKKKETEKYEKRLKQVFIISLVLTGTYFYLTNYNRLSYDQYFTNDSRTEVILHAGNFFNQNPLDHTEVIMLEDLDVRAIYFLLSFNLNKSYYDFSNILNYTYFKNDFNAISGKYVIFYIGQFNSTFKSNFNNDFEIIYETSDEYIFANLK